MQVGNLIKFGSYTWRILEVHEDKILVLTEEIIGKMPYHLTYKAVTWETSDIRAYLNGDFYMSFTEAEKEKILLVVNKNNDNPWYHTSGGSDTKDYVFLLDVEDAVCKYFGDSSDKLVRRNEKERYWFGKNDKNNIKRLATYQGCNHWWWLRSPGKNHKDAVYIHGNPIGCVGINGNSVFFSSYPPERHGGIRPALWLKTK